MKQYKLYRENAYGNTLIATFEESKNLLDFINVVPPPAKYHYFIVETEMKIKSERISVESFKRRIKI